jgi:hypothetical protein
MGSIPRPLNLIAAIAASEDHHGPSLDRFYEESRRRPKLTAGLFCYRVSTDSYLDAAEKYIHIPRPLIKIRSRVEVTRPAAEILGAR